MKGSKQLVLEYLTKRYERPRNNLWEEGKTYFIPEEHGIRLLQDIQLGTGGARVTVYEAALWFIHWGPEKFFAPVWAVRKGGKPPQLGVFEDPADVVSEFPGILKGMTFESPKLRERLALLVGRMVAMFYSELSSGKLMVASEGNCEWAEQVGDRNGFRRRVAASCFSEDGVLERIILAQRE